MSTYPDILISTYIYINISAYIYINISIYKYIFQFQGLAVWLPFPSWGLLFPQVPRVAFRLFAVAPGGWEREAGPGAGALCAGRGGREGGPFRRAFLRAQGDCLQAASCRPLGFVGGLPVAGPWRALAGLCPLEGAAPSGAALVGRCPACGRLPWRAFAPVAGAVVSQGRHNGERMVVAVAVGRRPFPFF